MALSRGKEWKADQNVEDWWVGIWIYIGSALRDLGSVSFICINTIGVDENSFSSVTQE